MPNLYERVQIWDKIFLKPKTDNGWRTVGLYGKVGTVVGKLGNGWLTLKMRGGTTHVVNIEVGKDPDFKVVRMNKEKGEL